MRQLGDLLVWFAMIGVLTAVVYFTPKLAQYMSSDSQLTPRAGADRSLALRLMPRPAPTE